MASPFELFLLDSRNGNDVVALARRGADTAIEIIPIDAALRALADFGRLLGKAVTGDAQRPSTLRLNSFGSDLFNFLFRGSLRNLYYRLPAGAISLQILSDHPDIKQVPWEYLGLPDRLPAPHRDRSVIRVHPTCGVDCPEPKKIKKNVKILFVSADPVDEAGVQWSDVLAVIKRTFITQMPDDVAIKVVEGATRAALLQAIAQENFDVFHFFGHGAIGANNQGQLVLEDVATGQSERLSANDLSVALSGKGIQLAILSACLTGAGNHADDFGIIATALIASGIPAVIANQYPITYKSISPFVRSIYSSLIQYGDIDRAVAEGRVTLSVGLGGTVRGEEAVVEWGIPTLYRLADARQLFEV